jgi:hypothetical protein
MHKQYQKPLNNTKSLKATPNASNIGAHETKYSPLAFEEHL